MSLSTEIVGVSTSTTSVNVPRLNMASLTLIGSGPTVDKNTVTAKYRLASGDNRYPLSVIFKVTDDKGVSRCSASITTFVAVTDSVTGKIDYTPITSVFAVNIPSALVDLADLATLMSNTFGLVLGTVAAGVPDWAGLSNLMFGVPKP